MCFYDFNYQYVVIHGCKIKTNRQTKNKTEKRIGYNILYQKIYKKYF